MNRILSSMLGAVLAAALPLGVASAQLGFTAVGPVDPVNGFPSSYTDTNGLSLAPCLEDPVFCGLVSPINTPVAGQAFPTNYGGTFPVELFYSRCVAKMNTTGTSLATLVIALEGSFLNGNAVQAGDQTTFARVRIRVQGLAAGQTYTVTTPVGTFTFVAANGSINNTDQAGGVAAGDFITALSGKSGPFMRWDTGLPLFDAAGREYVGNFGLPHTITGSPAGTNFFRVDGPNVGGPGVNRVQTNLFTIVGRKATPPQVAPVAQFSATPVSGLAPLNVSFTDTSTGTVTAWLWNFGDGATSTLQNPTHTYALGNYAVSLQVTGPLGTNTLIKPAFISATGAPPPVASFTSSPNAGNAPLLVAFTDTSTGAPTSWLWNFGDGTTSSLQNPSHTYAVGTFSVSLTATGAGGSSTVTKPGLIVVTAAGPVANFSSTPNAGNAPLAVAFTNASTGVFTSSLWNFGDGTTSSLPNPTHTFAAGTFSVSLTVTGPGGSNTLTKPGLIVATSAGPVASFVSAPNSGTAPLNVSFTDTSTGTISTRLWSFGDGATSTLQNPTHAYAAGTFAVSLTVTGPGGTNTLTKPALIVVTNAPPPTLTLANPVPGTAGVPNTFVATGARPNSTIGFFTGQVLGAGRVQNSHCPLDIAIGIASPFRNMGTARSNAAGVATFVTTPSLSTAGKVFFFQAVEPATCSASNVVTEVL